MSKSTPQNPKTILIAAMRNEGPFLLEWIAYHRVVGFDEIILFADHSIDGSDELLDALAAGGAVTLIDNRGPGGHRNRAYLRAMEIPRVQAADWVMTLDTDEFLNIHTGKGKLADLLKQSEDADAISLAWRLFGHAGTIAFEDAPILPRLTFAAPLKKTVTDRQYGLKTLFRPRVAAKMGPHRPALTEDLVSGKTKTLWLNGSGEDVTADLLEKGWSATSKTLGYKLAQINHYMIRSAEAFALHNLQKPPLGSEPSPLTYADFTAFNCNHETDETILRHKRALTREMNRLRKIEGVGDAHDHAAKTFAALIRTMRTAYAKDTKSDIAKVLDARAAEAAVASQQVTEDKKPKKTSATAKAPTDDLAPRWLADLRRSKHRSGWYHSAEKFAAQFTQRSAKTLIVSFDNLSNVNDPSLARETWGYGFYAAEEWSHLGVMAFEKNWYRDEALFDFMEAQKDLFARFERVIMTGTSMGAYAATAFANLAPGCSVLAFSPQSTLARELVPWEERFKSGRKQDWTGRYRDAPLLCDAAKDVFVIYDPYFEPDRLHAERYQGSNVQHLKSWYSSHKSAQFMRRAEILKTVMYEAVADTLSAQVYYKMFRSRRDLVWYYNGLAEHLLEKGHLTLADQLASHLVTIKRPGIARMIREKL